MLSGPDPLVVLHMPGEHTQGEPLHDIARHRGQADSPVVPRILLPALLVDGCSWLRKLFCRQSLLKESNEIPAGGVF